MKKIIKSKCAPSRKAVWVEEGTNQIRLYRGGQWVDVDGDGAKIKSKGLFISKNTPSRRCTWLDLNTMSIKRYVNHKGTWEVFGQSQPTYEMVDLGLPSGLKWAKCNIGAKKETDRGLYFQWGATEGYADASHSTWSTAPFNNGSSEYDETYFNTHKSEWLDGDVLKPQYDAATVNMGEGWRMPTKADWDELLANTTNEWVTNYNDSGVNGGLFTSNSNSNTLFIPASGNANGGSIAHVGSRFYVWNSSLYTSNPNYAWCLRSLPSNCSMLGNYRWYAFSLRGVSE